MSRAGPDDHARYPPIGDYGLISDCRAAALVSRSGSIDWCCTPRLDHGSCFGRLLDWDAAGHCSVVPIDDHEATRSYLDDTMVLATTFRTTTGEARLLDAFAMREGDAHDPDRRLLRVIEGVRSTVTFRVEVAARFDYGEVPPWIRLEAPNVWSAAGGDDALVIGSDVPLEVHDHHDLVGEVEVHAGERAHLILHSCRPEDLDESAPTLSLSAAAIDDALEQTIEWWRTWTKRLTVEGQAAADTTRSALVLKALTYAPTGAIAAAATTSLPETPGGERNWDYRYAWVRDSQFTVRALAELGCDREAERLRRFMERSAAGGADALQIVYGLGGERRLPELTLDLEGYRGAHPVRVGNSASQQRQLDVYGELLDLAWQWHRRGHSPDDDYWRFLTRLVAAAAEHWDQPDQGIWEMRGEPQHHVHSKVMCWAALDRGIRLATDCLRTAPVDEWTATRDHIRRSIERHGVDSERGCFVQHYDTTDVDAALLLLPTVDFVPFDDPRMVATVDAVVADLDEDGLLRRHNGDDGLKGREGTFVPCTFWLAECYANQDRGAAARRAYDRAVVTANDLGLYGEEYDPATGEILGNFPQALTHLSQIAAALAVAGAERDAR